VRITYQTTIFYVCPAPERKRETVSHVKGHIPNLFSMVKINNKNSYIQKNNKMTLDLLQKKKDITHYKQSVIFLLLLFFLLHASYFLFFLYANYSVSHIQQIFNRYSNCKHKVKSTVIHRMMMMMMIILKCFSHYISSGTKCLFLLFEMQIGQRSYE